MNCTAIIKKVNSWWIGWIEEIPGVNCQEKTREKLIESLTIASREIIQINKAEALAYAESDFTESIIAI